MKVGIMNDNLVRLVKDLPELPGVYIWKDKFGKILYIGKAKSLKKRVSSYLRKTGLDRRIWEIMNQAQDLETIVTSTEREALIVEATLIKKHQPKYNIALKDDRRHAWLRIDPRAKIPTLTVTRDVIPDGSRYFGPYHSTRRLEKMLDTIRRFIPIATCKNPETKKRECIDFHLGRCAGPCKNHIQVKEYASLVNQMILFLEGKETELVNLITTEMNRASKDLDFEKAAILRDRLEDVQTIMRRQKVFEVDGRDRDILGIARTSEAALIKVLTIRGGRLIGSDQFYFETGLEIPDEEILLSFVEQYYFSLPRLPEEILLPKQIPEQEKLEYWLRKSLSNSIKIIAPKTGRGRDLVEMANTNAVRSLRKILILGEKVEEIINASVKELREILGLRYAPLHIEGFDVANIQGTDSAGSCVVFHNGTPDKKSYRMFRIRSKRTPDDYAMIHEIIYRRYLGVLERGDSLPDLIIVDGGKGQLSSAVSALTKLGVDYIPTVAIAKREELLFTPKDPEPLALPRNSLALKLVQQVRDEAHRFAQKYYHKLREQHVSGSILDEAPNIGPKRRTALLREFGSIDRIRDASIDELSRVKGMTKRAAKVLKQWLNKESIEETFEH